MSRRRWVVGLTASLAPVAIMLSTLISVGAVPAFAWAGWVLGRHGRPVRAWLAPLIMLLVAAAVGGWANLLQPGAGKGLALVAWLAMTGVVLLAASLLSARGWLVAAVMVGALGSIVAADVATMVELWPGIGAQGLTRAGAPYWLLQALTATDIGPDRGAAGWLADDNFLQAACHICFAALAVPFVIGLARPVRPAPPMPVRRPEWARLDQAN